MVWWTGRVAIGLRHEPSLRRNEVLSQSALWRKTGCWVVRAARAPEGCDRTAGALQEHDVLRVDEEVLEPEIAP